MHYYQFNIGDYSSHTKHLSPTEDICYRRLLDYYYLHEAPIQNDLIKITRLLCLDKKYSDDVSNVLSEFFVLTDDGWINHRADKEIEQYQSFSDAGKRGAAKRWSKGGDKGVIGGLSGGVSKANAKQETRNNNHKTVTIYNPPIPAELLYEWISVRKKKKAGDVTELVWNALLREANKLNWTPEQAVTYCCEKSWINLDASWVKDKSVKPMKGYGFVSDEQFNEWLEPSQELING